MSFYVLTDFIRSCGVGTAEAFVLGGAVFDAKRDFNLKTMDEILAFVGNGGLENPVFVNTRPWDKNPNPAQPIMVDAYHFSAGDIYGYIAFMMGVSKKWNIKSFKEERSGDPRNLALADSLRGLVIPEKKERS